MLARSTLVGGGPQIGISVFVAFPEKKLLQGRQLGKMNGHTGGCSRSYFCQLFISSYSSAFRFDWHLLNCRASLRSLASDMGSPEPILIDIEVRPV